MHRKYYFHVVYILVLAGVTTGFPQKNESTVSQNTSSGITMVDREAEELEVLSLPTSISSNASVLSERVPFSPSFRNSEPLGYKMVEQQSFKLREQLRDIQLWMKREIEQLSNRVSGISRDIKGLQDNEIHHLKETEMRKKEKLKEFEKKFMEKLAILEKDANDKIVDGAKEADKLNSALSQLERKSKRAKRELKEVLKSDKSMAQKDSSKVLGPLKIILDQVDKFNFKG